MLEWASPWWFLALPVALFAPWLGRRPHVPYSAIGAVRAKPTIRVLMAPLVPLLGSLGLGLVVLSLARPQRVDREHYVEQHGIDIMMLLDTSGSMEAQDYTLGGRRVSRLEVAKEVMARFVDGRPHDRLGLVIFGEEAFTQVPLTTDHDTLDDFLREVQIGMAGKRATAIGDAIAIAAARLKALKAPSKVMVLLTDGRNNAGQVQPIQAAMAAKALGIRIYTIGVGRSGGHLSRLIRDQSDLDVQSLTNIARITGGRFFRATDTNALEKVYATIDKLEKSTAKVKEFVHREERWPPLLEASLVLLGMQALLGQSVLRRLP